MLNTLYYSILLISVLFVLTLILYFISYKSIIDREKMCPFECGFDPFESSHMPFSSHFFMIAIIFLVFDIEKIIIMPLIVLMTNMKIMYMYMYCNVTKYVHLKVQ